MKPAGKIMSKGAVKTAAAPPPRAAVPDGQKRGDRPEKSSPFRKPVVSKAAGERAVGPGGGPGAGVGAGTGADAHKGLAAGKHKPVKGLHGKTPKSVAAIASAASADADGYVFINGRRVRMISTKGLVTAKKSRKSPAGEQDSADEPANTRPAKSRLQRKELDEFQALLIAKRAQLVGDLSALEDQALQSSGGDLSHMPIHMADIGTDTYDQDFMLGMAAKDRELIREIDDALKRIADGTYGVCFMTGKAIPKARLNAKPWAKYTIEAARQFEQGRGS